MAILPAITYEELERLDQIAAEYARTTPAYLKGSANADPDTGQVVASHYEADEDSRDLVRKADLTCITNSGGAYLGEVWNTLNLENPADADFIAHAFEDVPFLLALIGRLLPPGGKL